MPVFTPVWKAASSFSLKIVYNFGIVGCEVRMATGILYLGFVIGVVLSGAFASWYSRTRQIMPAILLAVSMLVALYIASIIFAS